MTEPNAVEYVAAIATAVSALVIAWQAWQTRSSVKASQETVKASNSAVAVAQDALRESQLARLEAGVPRIFVIAQPWIDAAKVRGPKAGGERWESADVDPTTVFKLPRDGDIRLGVEHPITVRNDGPGSVRLQTAPQAVRYPNGDLYDVFSAGESRQGTYYIQKSVKEWVELAEAVARGAKPVANQLQITYTGPRDADVMEVHEVVVRGSCLVPVPDAIGDWTIEGDTFDTNMDASVLPAQRTYWRSRSQKLEF
jgi:hypothetical protein